MDKFEKLMKKNSAMSKEEKMKRVEMLKTMCICNDCPSYTSTGETELLFCGVGKSSIKDEKGCTCGFCPVVSNAGLTRLYYCIRGTEKEQRGI